MSFRLDYTVPQARNSTIPNPPGFLPPATARQIASSRGQQSESDTVAIQARAKKSTELKLRRAWELALSPAKSLPMQAVMLYFSGSGIQIFSLGMIFMLLTGPITAVINIFRAFEAFRPVPVSTSAVTDKRKADTEVEEPTWKPLILPMIAYVASQGLVLALGLYKCSSMGILPTGSGDWLHFETRSDPPEWSAVRAQSLG